MAINISQLNFFHKVKILIHTGEGKPGINHMKFWIPELMRTGVEFSVLTRNETVFKELSKLYKRIPILMATTPLEVESVINEIPKLTSILYTSNTGNNIHLLRFIDYKHIFIGSENSDRDSKINKFMRAYDEIWVSSNAVIDKIKSNIEIRHLKLIKIGKPQLKSIVSETRQKQKNRILYISSDEGKDEENNFSSLKILPYILSEVGKNNFSFDFLLSKGIGKRDKRLLNIRNDLEESAYQQNINCKFYDSLSEELLVKNKYIICDIRTFSNKLLATNAIIFLYIPKDKIIENYTNGKYISYEFVYTFSEIEELNGYISEIKKGNDIMIKERKKYVDYWIGVEETMNDKFITQIKEQKN